MDSIKNYKDFCNRVIRFAKTKETKGLYSELEKYLASVNTIEQFLQKLKNFQYNDDVFFRIKEDNTEMIDDPNFGTVTIIADKFEYPTPNHKFQRIDVFEFGNGNKEAFWVAKIQNFYHFISLSKTKTNSDYLSFTVADGQFGTSLTSYFGAVSSIKRIYSVSPAYKFQNILDQVQELSSFHGFPTNNWLVGIRSKIDVFNKFDDKFYLFKGEKFKKGWKCTTNAGIDLLNPSNPNGEAVLKSNEIYYSSHERRMHRGKVLAYCQRIPLLVFRDKDRNKISDESGIPQLENDIGINIHPASYKEGNNVEKEAIGDWSHGCQVFAIRSDFDQFMQLTKGQTILTYCLLKEL